MADTPSTSNRPAVQHEQTASSLPLAQKIAARLTLRLPDGGIFRTMATLISPQLAVTTFRALANWGLREGAGGQITLFGNPFEATRANSVKVESIDEAVDFAVVRFESPVPDAPSGFISAAAIPRNTQWKSHVQVEIAGKQRDANVEGWFVGHAHVNGKLHLQLNVRSPEKFSYESIIGAPVIIEDQLAGIIALGNESEQLLYAVPTSAMIESKRTDAVRALVSAKEPTTSRVGSSNWIKQETIDRFSEGMRAVLARAAQIRENYKRKRVHIEHLLLALAERTDGQLPLLLAQLAIDLQKFLEPGLGPAPEGAEEADDGPPEFSGIPYMSPNARNAVLTAIAKANADGLETIEAAHLLFGVLSTTKNPHVQDLNRRGITPSRVGLPLQAAVLAGYQSDDPSGTDLLGITEEVRALASVMAAKTVEPPLSLGLFGDWGTGKSFFMNKLEARIKKLAKGASEDEKKNIDSPYCSNVLQITFNAWNYIDSDLWASLTAEIFENLAAEIVRMRDPDPKADSAKKRALVLAAASSSQSVLDEAERKKTEAEAELKQTEEKLAALQKSEASIEAELTTGEVLKQALGFAMQDKKMKEYIDDVKNTLQISEAKLASTEVQSEILQLKGTWRTILFTLKNEKRIWIWLAALALALGGAWLAKEVLGSYGVKEIATRVGAVLAAMSGLLVPFVRTSLRLLTVVSGAQASKKELIEKKKREQTEELEKRREIVRKNVEAEGKRVTAAHERIKELNEQLEDMRADRKMADFIRRRHESTDYTQHLGVISRVRKDLRHLSTLLRDVKGEQEELEKGMKARQAYVEALRKGDNPLAPPPLFPRIDRIILYIDDLDRCPEETVVKVLQAVHLLLAFPLFVVVVGVDPRWLLYSLQQSSGAFQSKKNNDDGEEGDEPGAESHWRSTPLNYLEKIFQIPYTLRPIGKTGFENLVEKYASQPVWALSSQASGGKRKEEPVPTPTDALKLPPTSTGPGSEVPPATEKIPEVPSGTSPVAPEPQAQTASVPASTDVPEVDSAPEHLNISKTERDFMKELHEFIPSPRAGKRFINIYRLLRASVKERERVAFLGDKQGGPYQAPMTLLAILTGYPDQAAEILRELVEKDPKGTWRSFCLELEGRILKPEAQTKDPNVDDRPGAKRNRKGQKASQEAEVGRAEQTEASDAAPAEEIATDVEREEWIELFKELRGLEQQIGNRQMDEFNEWAPKVARYSFQSGRVLYYQHE
jgi:hypothetical protein